MYRNVMVFGSEVLVAERAARHDDAVLIVHEGREIMF